MSVGDGKGLTFPNLDPGKARWQLVSAECGVRTPVTVV